MFLKRRTRIQDGKTHTYYSVCASLRVSRAHVLSADVAKLFFLEVDDLSRQVG
jgi:hypothetical protein